MNRFKFFLFAAFILSLISFLAVSQPVLLEQISNSGKYKKGEKIEYYFLSAGTITDSVNIIVFKNNKEEIEKKTILIENEKQLVYSGSFDTPCTVMLVARYKEGMASLGSVVEPDLLKPGSTAPDDFKAFWKQQKKSLNAMPWEVKSTPVINETIPEAFICKDIEINCLGPKPARGYYVKQSGEDHGSAPAVLLVHAAGVKGSWCRSEPSNALKYAKNGAICFDLNAHGMLNGQPEEYYDQLEKGELKDYWMIGVTSRDDFYFRGMYLRLLRAIEFLTRQPEWDGKRILVIGESQGGGQALAAAGLDSRVGAVVAIVPAMCDWLGTYAERRGGWPQIAESDAAREQMMKTIPYFDAANLLAGSRATIFTEIGFVDMTCPPASVYAAVSQSKGRKIVIGVPYRAHHQPAAGSELDKIWQETVYKQRKEFIDNYLH